MCCLENFYHLKAVSDKPWRADGFKDVPPTTLLRPCPPRTPEEHQMSNWPLREKWVGVTGGLRRKHDTRFTKTMAWVAHDSTREALVRVESHCVAWPRCWWLPAWAPRQLANNVLSFLEPLPVMNILPISYNVALFNPGISWELILAQLASGCWVGAQPVTLLWSCSIEGWLTSVVW